MRNEECPPIRTENSEFGIRNPPSGAACSRRSQGKEGPGGDHRLPARDGASRRPKAVCNSELPPSLPQGETVERYPTQGQRLSVAEGGRGNIPNSEFRIPNSSLRLFSVASEAGATPRIQGLVRVAAGPWALEEGWWNEEPVERDYWDLELSGGGLYRIYRDRKTGEWYADGMYD